MNLMYSCRKAAQLLSQQMDEPLGPIDRIRLRMHLSMCGNCSNIEKQLDGLRSLSAQLFAAGAEPDDADSGRNGPGRATPPSAPA